MKRTNSIPLLAAFGIIVLCLLGTTGAQRLLPDYKSQITEYEKSAQNSLLYLNKSDDLRLYPWDEFDPNNAVPASLEGMDPNSIICEFNENAAPKNKIPASKIKQNTENGICYLDDFRYKTESGERYRASLAFDRDRVYYLSCEPESAETPTSDEISAAFIKIVKHAEEFETLIRSQDEVEVESTKHIATFNPFYLFWERLELFPLQGGSSISDVSPIVGDPDFSVTDYFAFTDKNNICLSYTGKTYDLVMIYTPTTDEFIGFSFKPHYFDRQY